VLPPGAFLTLGILLAVVEWGTRAQAHTRIWRTVRLLWAWRQS